MPSRDPDLEMQMLGEIIYAVEHMPGVECDDLADRVRTRLALGQGRYGNTWRRRDNLTELLEETVDALAYGLLELQRWTEPVAARALLVVALEHVCAADSYARLARQARDR